MKNHIQLFEFIAELIDVQIKKYLALAKIGIGPDAGMNAALVVGQVDELLVFADLLMKEISQSHPNDMTFTSIFNQIRFHLDHEYMRGRAGWLIDANNIHTPEMHRLETQQQELYKIASEAKVSTNFIVQPITDTQRQCEHDSHAIAFLILELAIKLKKNPEVKLDESIPVHASSILRKHAQSKGRYHRNDIWRPLVALHTKCQDFLKASKHSKRNDILSKEAATHKSKVHQQQLIDLLDRYKRVKPNAQLFSNEQPHYYNSLQPSTSRSGNNFKLFGGMGAFAALAVCSLIAYLVKNQDENSATFTFNLNS